MVASEDLVGALPVEHDGHGTSSEEVCGVAATASVEVVITRAAVDIIGTVPARDLVVAELPLVLGDATLQ